MPEIVVAGSLNMDMVVRATALPTPGETVRGEPFQTFPGGKGANQAVAAAQLGAEVAMVGRVGADRFGADLLDALKSSGVDISMVARTADATTGTAFITVDEAGQNTIIISAGANGMLTPGDLDSLEDLIGQARILLLQLEIPIDSVIRAVDIAAQKSIMVLLNPAPSCDLPADLLKRVDCLIPNDVEAGHLSGIEVTDLATAKSAASRLLDRGVPKIIITLGQNGALLADGRTMTHVPAYPVEAIDATAAGDAFIGCLATGLVRSKTLLQATELACACGALTTTKLGAQASLPSCEELNRFLRAQGKSSDVSL